MKYIVPVNFVIDASSAAQAEEKMKDLLDAKGITDFSIHSPSGEAGTKPRLSERLQTFLDAEIQNNDDDTSGHTTDLDYVKGSLEQMPDDVLIEQCDYDGDLSPAEFAGHLNAEFDVLYAKYGGGTIVADLLPD
jgi:hypothetical protein